MKDPRDYPPDGHDLRRRAEARLAADASPPPELAPEQADRLIHELRVHQIELEMQNEDLRLSQGRVEESRSKYADLYDFAPVGYLTLDPQGTILEANLTAAAILGVERQRLLNRIFSSFLAAAERPVFRQLINNTLHYHKQQGEFRLQDGEGGDRTMLLDILYYEDAQGRERRRLTLTDVSQLKRIQEELRLHQEHLEELVENRTAQLREVNQQLQETNDTLGALFQAAPLAIGLFDEQGRILQVNPAAELIFGWPREELEGRHPRELAPEQAEVSQALAQRALEGGAFIGVEMRQPRRDGLMIDVSLSAAPLKDQQGRVRGFMALAEDITAKKQRENEIQRLASFPHLNPNPVLEVDEDGRVTYANPRAQRVVEQLGMAEGLQAFLPPDLKAWFAAARRGGPREYEVDLALMDKVYAVTVFFPHDLPSARLYAMDVTARRLAEAALEESEARLRLLGDNLPDSAVYQYVHEADGGVRFQYISAGIEKLNSVSPQEVINDARTLHRLTLPEYYERLIEAEIISARELTDVDMEVQMRRPDGQLRWMHLHSRPRRLADGSTVWDGVQTDITERHEALAALQESQRRTAFLADLIESSSQPFGVGRLDGSIVFVNAAYSRLLGYSQEEFLQMDWASGLTAPESRAGEEEILAELLRTGQPVRYVKEYIHKDGRRVPVELLVHLRRDEAGAPHLVYAFITDITERLRAHEDLQQALAKAEAGDRMLMALMEHVPEGITIADVSGALRMVSRCGQELLGGPHAGKSIDEVVAAWAVYYPDGVTPMEPDKLPLVRALRRGEVVQDVDLVQVNERGEKLSLLCNAAPIRNADGDITGAIAAWRDITARQEAEKALRESREDLNRAQSVAHIGSWRLDVLKNKLTWSDENHRIFGIPPGTPMTYQTFLGVVHPEDREYVDREWTAALRGEPYDIEHRLVVEGAVKWVRERVELEFDAGGRLLGGFGTTQDTTGRKEAVEEQQLTIQLLNLVNAPSSLAELTRQVTIALKAWSGCEAVGIRLRQGEDFPYFETSGFPAEFVELENSLCARDRAGNLRRDSQGNPVIECMCGNVIMGRINPDLPFFTPGGSFWTNSTTQLLAASTEQDRQVRTRNRCHGEGYESVALVPLRSGDDALGLLQFNDRAPGKFTRERIQLLERLADNLASGIARRLAEEALHESEERYRSLFENNHAVMLLIAPETGVIVDANLAAAAYYGYPLADLRGRQIATINTMEPGQVKAEMHRARTRQRRSFDFEHRLASGAIRDVEVFSGPLRLAGRELLYSIVHDITARKEAEEALRESEARFRSLFENMTEGVALHEMVYDDQGTAVDYRIVATNPAFAVQTGLSAAQTEGRLASETYGSNEPPFLETFARVARLGEAAIFETYFDPLQRHFAISATSPKPGQFVTVFEDITQRKRMEEALRWAHEDLEQRVEERTTALRLANENLVGEIEERRRVEARLQESEARFIAFMEHLPGLAVMRDMEGRYLFANRAWEETMGLAPGVWEGKTQGELWSAEQAADLQKLDFQVIANREAQERVETMAMADGPHSFLSTRFPILDNDGLPYMVGNIAIDITDRQRAEEQVAETGRLYRVLSRVNEAIIRGRDQEALFLQVCRLAVEEGLFRMAWVGLTDPLGQKVQVAAKYGYDMGYLDNLEITVADGPESQGPTGTAVRADRWVVCNDFDTDPRMAPWREKAMERGYHSSAAFPLRIGARVVGALTLYAHRPGFFTNKEIALLTSLADNLSFALESMDREIRRRQAEEALADHAKLVHDLYNHAPCGYHSLDRVGTYVQINDTELDMLGYSREEVVGQLKFSDLITPASLPTFFDTFPGLKERGWVKDLEYEMVRKDGTTFPVLLSATAITDQAGNFLMSRSTMFDITARRRAERALAEERQRFLDLLEHLPAFVYLQAQDYSMRFANREFRKRFGEANGKYCYTLMWGKDEPCPDCPTFTVFHTDQPKVWEWDAPDGRIYQVYDYPFADIDGSPLVLEMGIDITDRKAAEGALTESREKLRYLAERLLSAQEDERKRLAAELHDQLGHALLALKLHLSLIGNKLLPDQQDIKGEIRTQLDYINSVIQEVRRLYHDLSPGKVDDLGLTKALRILVRDFAAGMPQVAWEVAIEDLDGLFSLPVQTTIYRIVQEALTNIGKHANPSAVTISCTKSGHQVHFIVQDNGAGFDAAQALGSPQTGRGVGLAAMEERLNMMGGSFEIQSREKAGTRISFTIPTLAEGDQP